MKILRTHVEPALGAALESMGIENPNWKSMLAQSREHSQGDLSLPCFPFAKQLGKSPNDIAEELSQSIEVGGAIGEVNATGGYLNFKAGAIWLAEQLLSGQVRI